MAKKVKASQEDYTNTPQLGEMKKTELDMNDLFLIVNVEDKYRIALTNNWVTKRVFNSKEAAQEYIDSKPWELIMNVAGIIASFAIKEQTNK